MQDQGGKPLHKTVIFCLFGVFNASCSESVVMEDRGGGWGGVVGDLACSAQTLTFVGSALCDTCLHSLTININNSIKRTRKF